MRPLKKSLLNYANENKLHILLRDFSNENPFSPDEIGFDSTKPVIWECSYGHKIIESPHKRVRRGFCPYCGPKQSGSFAQCYPDLLPFWSENNSLKPDKTPPTYTGFIHWKCEHGHEWTRRIPLQEKLKSCPICEMKNNNLFSFRPDLLSHWDKEKNANTQADEVLTFSNKKYYWVCENGHHYTASPEALMRRKNACPICSSAGFTNPDLAKEWHPKKNGTKTPYDFSSSSQKIAWFICSVCGKEYSSRIASRVQRKTDRCIFCR